jgi:hypothetical protein
MTKVINNKEEFEKFYPYDKKYIKEYPKEYPCICKNVDHDGGIMGDWKETIIVYSPDDVDSHSYFRGYKDASKRVC